MKKILLLLAVASITFTACNSGPSAEEKEKQDSLASAATADSLLNSVTTDSLTTDTLPTDSLKKP